MTAYIASYLFGSATNPAPSTVSMAVKAGIYPLRLAKVEAVSGNAASPVLSVYRYSGATLTGGTTVTPSPFREAAPAASATAQVNPTISGTGTLVASEILTVLTVFTYQFAFDLLVAPGSAIYLQNVASGSTGFNLTSAAIQFEEVHLPRSV